MLIKFARIPVAVALVCLVAGCNEQADQPAAVVASAPAQMSPDATVTASLKNLRNNNVAALVEGAVPTPALAKLKTDWSKDFNKGEISDEDRQEFSKTMTKLTAPDAEAKLYAEVEPQLKQFDQQMAQQMPMMIAMGQGFIQSAVQQSKDFNDEQKKQALDAVAAIAKWAGTVKFTDPALVKQGIGIVCKTARDLNLKTIDELRALNYDQAMQKAGIVLAGMKKVLEVYGFSLDQTLDTTKVELVSSQGDNAKVKVSYTLLNTPLSTESDMVKLDGKWFGKQAVEQWNKAQQDAAKPKVAVNTDVAPNDDKEDQDGDGK